MREIWRKVKGFKYHEVSNLGRVRSITKVVRISDGRLRTYKGRVLRGYINNRGYHCVDLYIGKRIRKKKLVHRLVAEAFLENNYQYPEVNHKDMNKDNNITKNLEWCTSRQNYNHAKQERRKVKNQI